MMVGLWETRKISWVKANKPQERKSVDKSYDWKPMFNHNGDLGIGRGEAGDVNEGEFGVWKGGWEPKHKYPKW